ncbi:MULTISPECIES: hypothetical protein [Acinetobacter calcoaceticus/baumannii complex]|uniref:hypothetical protein n=1 Tax=Acinetobacter calcoaceticus/baumannii complex TaxID=909768 RepID=UPI00070D274C|nr:MULTISPECIES: hypothetical protein [Acinetobacter calcoaceticus/baumannii complex]KQF50313.1 hypothetical protein APC05_10620 [Acinetobacter pittii]KQF52404.1 hypothetical protein APC05_24610 [Acinetobacter pittii]MCK0925228.1 hypothetical protein [Acinetobacter pittii]MCU4617868.1 hypothetical protein [Acinetobacter pittii]OTK27764.1 hypothetical protein B9X43_08380 [Acinetobacter baumannii]
MIDFIEDAERQYEIFCKLAEEYGFLDINAANSGFRCTVKKPEFNAGWISFTGGVASCRDEAEKYKAEISRLKAEIDKAQVAQWQPIDTAPKDRAILLRNYEGIFQGQWDQDEKGFRPLFMDYHGCGCCGGGCPQPDLWMELPLANESGANS